MAFDFADIQQASHDEQIRAWSVEQTIDSLAGSGSSFTAESIIYRADTIEQFIKNGKKD